MAFITDKEELKPGLIIFRRGDVTHRNFYCRVKLPKDDRYKTIALGTPDREAARDRAFDHDADVRFRLKHDVPVFNRPFRQVAEEFIAVQQRRADTGEISAGRVKNLKNVLLGALDRYVGSTQIHLVGPGGGGLLPPALVSGAWRKPWARHACRPTKTGPTPRRRSCRSLPGDGGAMSQSMQGRQRSFRALRVRGYDVSRSHRDQPPGSIQSGSFVRYVPVPYAAALRTGPARQEHRRQAR